MSSKEAIKQLVPPLFIRLARWLCNRLRDRREEFDFYGDFSSWQEARKASTGYDAEDILQKVKAACLKVKMGEAEYERDSVIFDSIEYSWPLLAGLMWVAALERGRLNVLDFGGSLGSTYYQNRRFLRDLSEIRWSIVEQPNFVQVGKELFETAELLFYDDVETCIVEQSPDAIILSGVLQYLEKPYSLLGKALSLPFKYVLVDRTPFWQGEKDRLQIQRTPPSIYDASYPVWIFSLARFKQFLAPYEIVAEFTALDNGLGGYDHKGFVIKVVDK